MADNEPAEGADGAEALPAKKGKPKLIAIFECLLSKMVSEKTLLYNKIALVRPPQDAGGPPASFENAIDFYNLRPRDRCEAGSQFLKRRTVYYVPLEKKTFKFLSSFLPM